MGRSSPHLEGRNEVENRNEACVMEVAVMGSRAKLETKEGGKLNQATRLEWSKAECEVRRY